MEHPKTDITDLIPKGLGAYWLVFFVGVLSIGILEFGYFKMPVLAEALGVETIAPLDVASRGSLLVWGVSMLLVLSSFVCLLNFGLGRKHQDSFSKTNAWFWSALILFFLGMDVQVALREPLRDALVALSGTTLYQGGTLWWLAVYGFVLAVVGTRLFLAMTAYSPALGLFLLSVAGTIAGVLIDMELVPVPLESREIVMLESGIQASAALFLLLSLTLFARRQVFRDPEVARRWFAKVWNQPSLLSPSPEKPATVAPVESKPRVESPVADKSQPVASPETVAAKPVSGITLSNRPLVQKTDKPADVVPFHAAKGKKDSDDFDLAGIA